MQEDCIMVDQFGAYMTMKPEIEYNDVYIDDFSIASLSRFADSDGAFTKSFDAVVKSSEKFEETFIVSSIAQYESESDAIPAVQIRIIDDKKDTLYYTPVYEIGHKREFYRREWRIPPGFDRYRAVRISFIIPEGVRLYLKKFNIKSNYGFRERDIGIRYHGHNGCTGVIGMQLIAEMGFTSCITIPKFTKDGIGVCMHDDTSIITELYRDDGTIEKEGGPYDKPLCEFTYAELMQFSNAFRRRSDVFAGQRVPTMDEYFAICSSTGMQPIFSVHPELTKEQWLYVRELLIKHRLLEHFWVKSGRVNTQKICLEVFGTEIAGRILLSGAKSPFDPAERAKEIGLDIKRHNVVMEYFGHVVTEEQIINAKKEGFKVSIAAMRGGVSGPQMRRLIDLGVTEFTVDRHCSMGLSW